MRTSRIAKILSALATIAVLTTQVIPTSAEMSVETYEVTITNLTEMQVFSPPIFVTHAERLHVWSRGALASDEARLVAETGDTSALASMLEGAATNVVRLEDPLPPGASMTVTIGAGEGDVLSALTMLVQTNDGITGLDSLALSEPASTRRAEAYDAGTEENTELASDVPGPPFGGMNRAPTTPPSTVSVHQGIMGGADVATEFDWDGPVAEFTVRAIPSTMPKTGGGGATSLTSPWLISILLVTLAGLALGSRLAVRTRSTTQLARR